MRRSDPSIADTVETSLAAGTPVSPSADTIAATPAAPRWSSSARARGSGATRCCGGSARAATGGDTKRALALIHDAHDRIVAIGDPTGNAGVLADIKEFLAAHHAH